MSALDLFFWYSVAVVGLCLAIVAGMLVGPLRRRKALPAKVPWYIAVPVYPPVPVTDDLTGVPPLCIHCGQPADKLPSAHVRCPYCGAMYHLSWDSELGRELANVMRGQLHPGTTAGELVAEARQRLARRRRDEEAG